MRKIIFQISIILCAMFMTSVMNAQSHWSFDGRQYANNMTVTGNVSINGTTLQSARIEVAAFSGSECRGTQFLQQSGDNWICYLTVFGSGSGNEPITFRVYDHAIGREYTATNAEAFQINAILGNPATPYLITVTAGYTISYNLNGGSGASAGTYSAEGIT
jgi:hypothetical protein